MMDDFEPAEVETGEVTIFVRRSGSGAPVLLLHGFPQTHLRGHPIKAGHFFPEEAPGQTADTLSDFFAVTDGSARRNRD
jgi:pimeloyl-ACP methyl ester carboxylesterase